MHGNFKDAGVHGICKKCGVSFYHYDTGKFCSKKCYFEYRRVNSIKHNHRCSCGKIIDLRNKKCRTCFGVSIRGRKLSKEHIDKIKSNLQHKFGKDCNFFKDGRSPISRLIRFCKKSSEWRKAVFFRDNYTCQFCKIRGGYLEVDHIFPFKDLLDEFLKINSQFSPMEDKETLLRLSFSYDKFWDISNGRTLCKKCHLKTETHGIKTGGYSNACACD